MAKRKSPPPRQPGIREAFGSVKRAKMLWDVYNRPGRANKIAKKTNRGTGANTVSFQRDIKQQYRRRRMPYRKKRTWIKFTRKVKAVEKGSRGTQQIIINDGYSQTWVNNVRPGTGADGGTRKQNITEVNLYSCNANVQGGRDKDYILNEVSNNRTDINPGNGLELPGNLTNEATRLKVGMSSAHIDITYTNSSTTTLEVDLYTLVHRNVNLSGLPAVEGQVDSLEKAQTCWINESVHQLYYPTVGGTNSSGETPFKAGGAEVLLDMRGITPFQTWGIGKYAGAKVLNKTKVLIAPGNSLTRRYADNRPHTIYSHMNKSNSRYDRDTKTYLAIARGTGNIPDDQELTFTTAYTKVYTWNQEGVKTPRQSYMSNDVLSNIVPSNKQEA